MSALAENYARAVVEASAANARKVERALVQFVELLNGSVDLARALASPTVDSRDQIKIVEELATKIQLPNEAINLLKLAIRKKRMRYIREIVAQVTQLVDSSEGIVSVEITTAKNLDDAQRKQFESLVSQNTNVRFAWRVQADLIGGAVARIGDSRWDGSIRRQLDDLRHSLTIKSS